jgi:hypothetical protein
MVNAWFLVDWLVRRYSGRNQDHAAELEVNISLLGADQVTKMWRIEGSAQDADSHQLSGRRSSRSIAPAARAAHGRT